MRDQLVEILQREVIGPDSNVHYTDPVTNEEILLDRVHGAPWVRYGAGMLYPQQSSVADESVSQTDDTYGQPNDDDDPHRTEPGSTEGTSRASGGSETDSTEEPIGLAYQYKPSAMGFTASFDAADKTAVLTITVRSAWYERGAGHYEVKQRTRNGEIEIAGVNRGAPFTSEGWVRRPIPTFRTERLIGELLTKGSAMEQTILHAPDDSDWLKLRVFNRTTARDETDGVITLTFTLTNCRQSLTQADNAYILYQNELLVEAAPDVIKPYREKISSVDTHEEEELRLLYRKKRVYGIGHGCSVVWETNADSDVDRIGSSFLPVYEIPPVDPTVHIELSMYELSDRGNWEAAKDSLRSLRDAYAHWIEELAATAASLDPAYRPAADRNIAKCRLTLLRISRGIDLLTGAAETDNIVRCFRLMNRAMLWQQQRSKTSQRRWISRRAAFDLESLPDNSARHNSLEDFHNSGKGRWRPFQLAFVLMNLEGIWDESSGERSLVDLIWFPTGGGKTEAYLGLTAFTVFVRRVRGYSDRDPAPYSGTAILMRYTLRLLTTQQYERAASLICACELIRKEAGNRKYFGSDSISIGLWVGRDSTPNDQDQARAQFKKLKEQNNAEYGFIVMKCPCCGAQIGKVDRPTAAVKIKGMHKQDGSNGRVIFQCANPECEYSGQELPLYVVDEDIYDNSPTLLLGTVDKFAMIPWKREAGTIFGFRMANNAVSRISPPELIIQDELHLISGPLGTVVGLYETLIQTLCTDYRRQQGPFFPESEADPVRPPKIVASSATISRAAEQVQALYNTAPERLHIFPSQGLNFGDTWFSQETPVTSENPGRRYVGVLAPGYQSGQTTVVRTYSPVLQQIRSSTASVSRKDYYWTLLGFFNSIRELGMASSLIFADVSEYLYVTQKRNMIPFAERRRSIQFRELTSRINSSQIPEALKELEKSYQGGEREAIDVCLATNMIATGLDVTRLGLMFIHGQPKTTAEYIQASSRVGRSKDGPGLVVMLYSPSKPRDKSIYEQFQAYHSRIYAHVEPTSVTPFSIDSRKRALHAVLIGLMRHFAQDNLRNTPSLDLTGNPNHMRLHNWAVELVRDRVRSLDPGELSHTEEQIRDIIGRWQIGFQYYGDAANAQANNRNITPLMYAAGSEVSADVAERSMLTPTTMRGVDEEVHVSILNPR